MPIFLFPIWICFVWDIFYATRLCHSRYSDRLQKEKYRCSLYFTPAPSRGPWHINCRPTAWPLASPCCACCCGGVSNTLFSQVNQCMRRQVDKEPVAALSMISTHLTWFLLIFSLPSDIFLIRSGHISESGIQKFCFIPTTTILGEFFFLSKCSLDLFQRWRLMSSNI